MQFLILCELPRDRNLRFWEDFRCGFKWISAFEESGHSGEKAKLLKNEVIKYEVKGIFIN